MKKLIIGISILFSIIANGQNQKDLTLFSSIQNGNNYLSLKDSINLPNSISPYCNLIIDYFQDYQIDANDYFILKSSIVNADTVLTFSMYHFDGFARKENSDPIKGNASGKDGDIKIDIKNKKVISFIGYK